MSALKFSEVLSAVIPVAPTAHNRALSEFHRYFSFAHVWPHDQVLKRCPEEAPLQLARCLEVYLYARSYRSKWSTLGHILQVHVDKALLIENGDCSAGRAVDDVGVY